VWIGGRVEESVKRVVNMTSNDGIIIKTLPLKDRANKSLSYSQAKTLEDYIKNAF
jgi:hypothetical protein